MQREARARELLGKCPTLHPEFVPGVEARRASIARGERDSSTRAPKATVRNLPARSTRQPSNFDAAAITIVVTLMTGGAAVNDTSPSRGGNDLRPRWMVQVVRRMDNGCGMAIGARTTEHDLETRMSPRATRRLKQSARDERGGADAKRRRTPTLISEAAAW